METIFTLAFCLKKINIANTAMNWSGKRWAMIMLPLSQDKNERLGLLAMNPFIGYSPH
jgi:hypothetical protein